MYVDQNLYHGRPVSGQRLDKELRCYDLLDRLGLAYDRADHDAADTIEACAAVEQVLGAGICKNLFLTNRQQTAFYLLLMPGHKPFRTKDLSHQIGSARLSFASPEHMLELLDIAPGSVSVLGLMNDHDGRVRLLIDRDLLQDAYLCCHPCINTSTLKLRMADAIDVLIPALAHAPTYVDLPVYEPQTCKSKKKILHPKMQDFLFALVVTLILVLASSLRLFAATNAGALVVLLAAQIRHDAGLGTAALKSLERVVQRLVLLDVDFRHFIPSLQIRLAALQGPSCMALALIL